MIQKGWARLMQENGPGPIIMLIFLSVSKSVPRLGLSTRLRGWRRFRARGRTASRCVLPLAVAGRAQLNCEGSLTDLLRNLIVFRSASAKRRGAAVAWRSGIMLQYNIRVRTPKKPSWMGEKFCSVSWCRDSIPRFIGFVVPRGSSDGQAS
jgi:hypothetical protein